MYVCVGGGAEGLPSSTQGASKLKILAHASSFHSPLACPLCLPPLHLAGVSLLATLTHQEQNYFCNAYIITPS